MCACLCVWGEGDGGSSFFVVFVLFYMLVCFGQPNFKKVETSISLYSRTWETMHRLNKIFLMWFFFSLSLCVPSPTILNEPHFTEASKLRTLPKFTKQAILRIFVCYLLVRNATSQHCLPKSSLLASCEMPLTLSLRGIQPSKCTDNLYMCW